MNGCGGQQQIHGGLDAVDNMDVDVEGCEGVLIRGVNYGPV